MRPDSHNVDQVHDAAEKFGVSLRTAVKIVRSQEMAYIVGHAEGAEKLQRYYRLMLGLEEATDEELACWPYVVPVPPANRVGLGAVGLEAEERRRKEK